MLIYFAGFNFQKGKIIPQNFYQFKLCNNSDWNFAEIFCGCEIVTSLVRSSTQDIFPNLFVTCLVPMSLVLNCRAPNYLVWNCQEPTANWDWVVMKANVMSHFDVFGSAQDVLSWHFTLVTLKDCFSCHPQATDKKVSRLQSAFCNF